MGACLIALAIRTANYPLLIAANRDEDYDRPTLPAHFWSDAPDILGGRDALHGGTWLAVTLTGRFAAVTNLRGSRRDPRKRSRGELVSVFIFGDSEPWQYMTDVAAHADEYAGFHLLAGRESNVVQLCGAIESLTSGVHALSNAPAGVRWPKVDVAEEEIGRIARIDDPQELIDATLRFLSAPRGTTSVESEVFVAAEQYGTRSSTVVLTTHDRRVFFAEQSFGRGGARDGDVRRFSFALSAP